MLKKLKKTLYALIILAVLAGTGYFLYKNPEVLSKLRQLQNPPKVETKVEAVEFIDMGSKNDIENIYHQIAVLQDSIVFINNRIADVKDEISGIAANPAPFQPEKSAEMLEETKKLIDSKIEAKADANIVMGLITRMDKAEERLEKVAKISDKGALVLSAALLVKDRADRGDAFRYEAEVLTQLSDSEPKIQEAVQTIAFLSAGGVETAESLASEFLDIYNGIVKKEERDVLSWKDRIKNKFNEVVRVKQTNVADSVEETQKKTLDIAGNYVSRGEFVPAVRELEKAGRPEFAGWLVKAEKRIAFEQAVSQISAHALALMKINQIGGLKPLNDE